LLTKWLRDGFVILPSAKCVEQNPTSSVAKAEVSANGAGLMAEKDKDQLTAARTAGKWFNDDRILLLLGRPTQEMHGSFGDPQSYEKNAHDWEHTKA
jgi:hypothetical protein